MSDIDELHFEDATPPDSPPPADPITGGDVPPATDEGLSCEVCGTPLVYSGRGRKPKRCDEHKRNKSASAGGTVARKVTPNDKLARQATTALVQINRLTGFGVRMLGLSATSEMIMHAEQGFEEQAYEALLTDPDLCKQILAVGQVSGKFSLLTAYALLLGQVGPVALMEIKAKRAEKEQAAE